MTLAYISQAVSYEQLRRLLRTREFGTPVQNVTLLAEIGVNVTLREFTLAEITQQLQVGNPVIAFINTADLPYWNEDTDHAVVIVGIDEQFVYLNDPYFPEASRQVPRSLFELSLLRFDYLCAVFEAGGG